MKRNCFAALLPGAALTASLLFAGGAAKAQQQNIQNFTFMDINGGAGGAGDDTANLYSNGNFVVDAYVGRYDATVGSTSAYVFCTDLTHDIGVPDGYSTLAMLGSTTAAAQTLLPTPSGSSNQYYQSANGTPGGLASALTNADYLAKDTGPDTTTAAQRASEVAYLTQTYLNSNLTTDQYAGVQLAIWNIVQGGGVTTDNATLQGLATTYEGIAASNSTFGQAGSGTVDNTTWIQGPRDANTAHKQDFVTDPVPEPAFYQMAALCVFGFMGVGRFRKRKGQSK